MKTCVCCSKHDNNESSLFKAVFFSLRLKYLVRISIDRHRKNKRIPTAPPMMNNRSSSR